MHVLRLLVASIRMFPELLAKSLPNSPVDDTFRLQCGVATFTPTTFIYRQF